MIYQGYGTEDVLELSFDKYLAKIKKRDFESILPLLSNLFGANGPNLNLSEIQQMFSRMIHQQELLLKFYEALDDYHKKLIYLIVWERLHNIEDLEKAMSKTILDKKKKNNHGYNSLGSPIGHESILIFKLNYWNSIQSEVFIHPSIEDRLKKILPQPIGYEIDCSSEEEIKAKHHYKNDDQIIKQLYGLEAFCDNAAFKVRTDGVMYAQEFKKLNKLLLAKPFWMRETLSDFTAKEFSQLETWQGCLWMPFIEFINKTGNYTYLDLKKNGKELGLFRNLVSDLEKEKLNWVRYVCGFIEGKRQDFDELNCQTLLSTFFNVLSLVESKKWYRSDDINNYIRYRSIDFAPTQSNKNLENLQLQVEYSGFQSRESLRYLGADGLLRSQLVSGMLFFLAQIGLVEIKYNDPLFFNFEGNWRSGKALIPTSGLVAFRFTSMGEYVLGMVAENEVDPDILDISRGEKVFFNKQHLLIRYKGTDPFVLQTLNQLSKPLKGNHYKVSQERMFKDCLDETELDDRICRLEKLSDSALPPLWEDFIDDLWERTCSVEVEDDYYIIVKFNDRPELIEELGQIKWIREHTKRLEKNQLLVNSKKQSKLFREIRKLGYLT